ncbi:MAG: helix-turn-helix transcriptional regulator [Deltaproteobacteria bacterium]|nr:helix-turn-helix transcriptional regulator [Deltaproteobacteria bacterium]
MTEPGRIFDEYEALLRRMGENLARVRMARGMTQRQLAQVMGKNQGIVAKVEKYPSRDITFRCLYEVCRALPVSMGDVVTEAEKELELYKLSRAPSAVSDRMKNITGRLNSLPEEEQVWMAEMIEGLLKRTRLPAKITRRTDRSHLMV